MKISDVRAYPVKSPTAGRGGPGFLFVKLTTDSGVEGIGEIYCIAFSPFVGASMAEDVCDRLVIGADPFKIERLWRVVYSSGYTQHPDLSLVAILSGIEMACWDIIGKEHGKPVYELPGGQVHERLRTAAFAEACVVHHSQLVRIPKEISFVSAALLGCGVITGFCSVTKVAAVESGSRVAVIGAGGLRFNTIQGAALSGASVIIAVDVLDNKLQAAREFGATHTFNALHKNAATEVTSICNGGADYVFVTAGRSDAFSDSIDMLHKYGTSVILGMPPDDDRMFSVDSHLLTTGLKVVGSKLGDTRIKDDIPNLICLYQQSKLKLDELVSSTFPLGEINDAIETAERGEALRNVIVFD